MENEDQYLDDPIKLHKTDGQVKYEIEAMMNGESIEKLSEMENRTAGNIAKN